MELGLLNQCVLITGASRGIGRAAAECFASEGCRLRLVARNRAHLDATASHLTDRYRVDVQAMALDLREPGSVEQLDRLWGHEIDVLVNNAGDMAHGSLEQIDALAWRTAWDLKVYGTIDLSRLLYARMKARASGVMVNVIGISGGEMVVPS